MSARTYRGLSFESLRRSTQPPLASQSATGSLTFGASASGTPAATEGLTAPDAAAASTGGGSGPAIGGAIGGVLVLAALAGGAYLLHLRAQPGASIAAGPVDVLEPASSAAHGPGARGPGASTKHHTVAQLLAPAPSQVGEAGAVSAGLQGEFYAINPMQMIPHRAPASTSLGGGL